MVRSATKKPRYWEMHKDLMKSRKRFLSALGLLFAAILAFAGVLSATQTVDESLARITADGKSGSAFVVALQGRTAFLATAKHVVEGQGTVLLTFSVDRSRDYAGEVVQNDTGEDLALLRVADAPAAIKPLAIVTDELPIGEDVLLAGFPRRTIVPRYSKTALSSREGSRLVFYEGLDFGNSGGPVLNMDGQVVGLVVEVERNYSRAIPATTLRPALASWLSFQLPVAVHESSTGEEESAPSKTIIADARIRSDEDVRTIKELSERASLALGKKRYKDAFDLFSRVIEFDEEYARALANVYDGERAPWAAAAYAGRAAARLNLGQPREACRDAHRACELKYCEGLVSFQRFGLCRKHDLTSSGIKSELKSENPKVAAKPGREIDPSESSVAVNHEATEEGITEASGAGETTDSTEACQDLNGAWVQHGSNPVVRFRLHCKDSILGGTMFSKKSTEEIVNGTVDGPSVYFEIDYSILNTRVIDVYEGAYVSDKDEIHGHHSIDDPRAPLKFKYRLVRAAARD